MAKAKWILKGRVVVDVEIDVVAHDDAIVTSAVFEDTMINLNDDELNQLQDNNTDLVEDYALQAMIGRAESRYEGDR